MWDKTKKQRRQWWNNLSPEQQAKQLDKWQAKKAAKRKARSIRIMAKAEIKHNCSSCYHYITKNCKADMKWGCEYWYNPNSQITGLAYPKEEPDKKKWLETIESKNKWLKIA